MDSETYQTECRKTNLYPKMVDGIISKGGAGNVNHPAMCQQLYALGLSSESGEVASIVKKISRDRGGVPSVADQEAVKKELGDCMWYLAHLADSFGLTLEEVMRANVDKLRARAEAGTIQGSGDNR